MRGRAILCLLSHGFRLVLVVLGGIRWEIPPLWLLGTVAVFVTSMWLPRPSELLVVWRVNLIAAGLELFLNVFIVWAWWMHDGPRLIYHAFWAASTALTLVTFSLHLGVACFSNGRRWLAIGAMAPSISVITSAIAFIALPPTIGVTVCLSGLATGYIGLGLLVAVLPTPERGVG